MLELHMLFLRQWKLEGWEENYNHHQERKDLQFICSSCRRLFNSILKKI